MPGFDARSSSASSASRTAGIAPLDLRGAGCIDLGSCGGTVGGLRAAAGMARIDGRRTTVNRAWMRPSLMTAWMPTEPRPSTRVVHATG